MTLKQLHTFFSSRGWAMKPNSSAYYSEKAPNVRYKVTKIALRKEVKVTTGWARVKSGYISKLHLSEEGKLSGLIR